MTLGKLKNELWLEWTKGLPAMAMSQVYLIMDEFNIWCDEHIDFDISDADKRIATMKKLIKIKREESKP